MSNLKGKKLLIMGGAYQHSKIVRAAKNLGVITYVTDFLPIEDAPAKQIADYPLMYNVTELDELVEFCKKEEIDGIVQGALDFCQRPYQRLCERLNLPCYGTEEQFRILTDKTEFKKFCTQTGVDIIPSYKKSDFEDLKTCKDRVSFPILIKPCDSRGSRGQTICFDTSNVNEAIEFAETEASNDEIIIEKFMDGYQDFSMTYFVVDGVPYMTRIGDRYLGSKEDGLNKQCIFSTSPSKHKEMYLENVHPKVCAFIKELGIKYGPVFMQGFVDGNTVRFYDPGLRFPGTEYETLLYKATGINLMELLVEFALTGKTYACEGLDNAYNLDGYNCAQMLISVKPGTITKLSGEEEIANHPSVLSIDKRYKIGDVVPQSGDVKQRIAEVVILERDFEKVKETINWVYNTLVVKDENDEDMIVSKIDTNIL